MSATPREIGTLIVVVLRANHLPNKRHIGKQDPYCTVTVNGERRRTKAIKRGGQHPDWDEEIRFTIFEDNDDILARTAKGDGTPPPPPPKDENKTRKIKGGKSMKLACYADDSREPDLIGECNVDLTEVLTKGETDDWFTLMNKDKFAGKVYLELTFWSNEPAPEKKPKRKMTKNSNQYAGPGSFIPAGNHSNSPSESHSRQGSDVLPSHMRISNHANLYVAPYENNWNSQVDGLTQELGDFRLTSQARRRESFPPVVGAYSQTPYGGHSTMTPYHAHDYDQSLPAPYPYERPVTPGQSTIHFPHSTSGPVQYSSYQPTFDAAPTYHVPSRGPRHSIATSSGFMPLPQVSGFLPLSSHASEPSGFIPPVSHTPAPVVFTPQFPTQSQNVYSSPMSPTPGPSQHTPYLSHSTSLSFHPQQSHPSSPQSSYNYSSYNIPASASAPPQQFVSSPPPQPNYPPPANTAPPQMYPSSSHEVAQSPSVMYPNGNMSRPLPQQPQVIYPQMQQHPPIPPSQSLPELPPPPPLDLRQTNYPASNGYSEIPPPPAPPAPALQYNNAPSDVSSARNGLQLVVPPPPPPPPLSSINGVPRGRRTSLPAPPVSYQQPTYPQPHPAPASLDMYSHIPPPPPPPALNSTLDRGLPKPPIPVNEHGQWIQPANAYSSQGY